jgi:hypothetical protein
VEPGSEVGGVGWLELEFGLGNWSGEESEELQESPEHLWVLSWRPWRRIPNPKTRPRTTSTVTTKMKIFVALPT